MNSGTSAGITVSTPSGLVNRPLARAAPGATAAAGRVPARRSLMCSHSCGCRVGVLVCRAAEGGPTAVAAVAPPAPDLSAPPAQERQLLAISPRQLERRLRTRKQTLKRRVYGTTRPGSLLKHMIPIKTDQWDVTKPGSLEIDLVSHLGASCRRESISTRWMRLTFRRGGWSGRRS